MKRVTGAIAVGDGVHPPIKESSAALILLDAPCSGLGALRRRPDARLRKKSSDIPELVLLQRALMESAVKILAPAGILGYVTCSPLARETIENRRWILETFADLECIDAREFFSADLPLPDTPDVQLWPGMHGTDAMYLALFRKK